MIKAKASLLLSIWLLTVTAHAQAPSGCYLEPWVANAGDAILTICSNSSISGCSGSPIVMNASAAGGLALAGFNLQNDCMQPGRVGPRSGGPDPLCRHRPAAKTIRALPWRGSASLRDDLGELADFDYPSRKCAQRRDELASTCSVRQWRCRRLNEGFI
jgi:hypothetical protein